MTEVLQFEWQEVKKIPVIRMNVKLHQTTELRATVQSLFNI
jgi:hypothetical protein